MKNEEKFWQWFEKHQEQIFNFEENQNEVLNLIRNEIKKVHLDLTFEISRIIDGKREFVISADGIRDAFPSVESLFSVAPKLSKWIFIKFRPRIDPNFSIEMNGLYISTDEVMFVLEEYEERIGIIVFMEGYTEKEHDRFVNIMYIFLDTILGEYDVETKVGFIELRPLWAESKITKKPIKELAENFDRKFNSLSN